MQSPVPRSWMLPNVPHSLKQSKLSLCTAGMSKRCCSCVSVLHLL